MSAGGVVYRRRDGHIEIVLVARPKHGLWALPKGTPEARETIEETIAYAQELNPKTIQVSLPAAYPGTFLYNQAKENGWLVASGPPLTPRRPGICSVQPPKRIPRTPPLG